jgi:aspartyl-tRNA(Asn)/glutamyl-tRNA(Gln) amidotransferase subunit C
MSIDERRLGRLEKLARIELTPAEKKRFAIQLDRIIGYVTQLQKIDTETVQPFQPPGKRAILRRDDPGSCLDRDTVLDEAPDTEDHHYRVPRVIER